MSDQPDYTPIDERESGYTAVELAAETLGKDLPYRIIPGDGAAPASPPAAG